jgi:hypothetical protein
LKYLSRKQKHKKFCGKCPVRSKLILDNQATKQFSRYSYLSYQLPYQGEIYVNNKLEKFNFMCGKIKPTSRNKTRMKTQIKFYKVMAVSPGPYGSDKWVLTEKDNIIQAPEMTF